MEEWIEGAAILYYREWSLKGFDSWYGLFVIVELMSVERAPVEQHERTAPVVRLGPGFRANCTAYMAPHVV